MNIPEIMIFQGKNVKNPFCCFLLYLNKNKKAAEFFQRLL